MKHMFPTCAGLKTPTSPMPVISGHQSTLEPISSLEDEELPPQLTQTASDVTESYSAIRKRTSSAAVEHLKGRSPKISMKLKKQPFFTRQGSAPNVLKVDSPPEHSVQQVETDLSDLPPVPPVRTKRKAKQQIAEVFEFHCHFSAETQFKPNSTPDLTFSNNNSSPKMIPKNNDSRKNSILTSLFAKESSSNGIGYGVPADPCEGVDGGSVSSVRDRQHSKGSLDMTALKNMMTRKLSKKKEKGKLGMMNKITCQRYCMLSTNIQQLAIEQLEIHCLLLTAYNNLQ